MNNATETMLKTDDKREAERIANFTASLDVSMQQRFADFISGMRFAESKRIAHGATVDRPAAGATVKTI